jgi:predicted membrane metal-binding protein
VPLSLGSGGSDFRGGNVFKLGDTLFFTIRPTAAAASLKEEGQTTIYHVLSLSLSLYFSLFLFPSLSLSFSLSLFPSFSLSLSVSQEKRSKSRPFCLYMA